MEKIFEYVISVTFLAASICAFVLIVLSMIRESKKNRKKPYLYGVGYKLIIIDKLPDSKPEKADSEKHDDSVDYVCRAAEYAAKMGTPINCSNFTTIPNKIRDYLVKNFGELCNGKQKIPEFRASLSFNEAMKYLSKNEGWNLTRLDSDKYIKKGYYLTSSRNEEEAEKPFSLSMVRVHRIHGCGSKLYHTFQPLMEDLDSKGWIAFKF